MTDIMKDPVRTDADFPPDMHSLFIEDRLLGLIYLAGGEGPHKTVLLPHGFPGNEQTREWADHLADAITTLGEEAQNMANGEQAIRPGSAD